eukprot:CAMPEP_0179213848 /NCGR_PEP_ID=MMETSP0797-20121207/1927_1 /TAXON_ID=47934 /ORGANISM="Dinophysis acuminata, Strain DAEP01" /LENGTH=166 /DNA_ID=CAMNT_0020919693 /DNA_START=45 /DNA_END=546 /DNA_ORIENTATION=+
MLAAAGSSHRPKQIVPGAGRAKLVRTDQCSVPRWATLRADLVLCGPSLARPLLAQRFLYTVSGHRRHSPAAQSDWPMLGCIRRQTHLATCARRGVAPAMLARSAAAACDSLKCRAAAAMDASVSTALLVGARWKLETPVCPGLLGLPLRHICGRSEGTKLQRVFLA